MATIENLIPNSKRTPKEVRENARKGGIKSGQVRKEKKRMREALLMLADTGDNTLDMCKALMQQAKEGNTKAFEIFRDTIGEKPVDESRVEQTNITPEEFYKDIDDSK